MKSLYLGLQTSFFIKPFLPRAKRPLTVPSFKALAVLFSDLQNSGYVKEHKVALPLQTNWKIYNKNTQQKARNCPNTLF